MKFFTDGQYVITNECNKLYLHQTEQMFSRIKTIVQLKHQLYQTKEFCDWIKHVPLGRVLEILHVYVGNMFRGYSGLDGASRDHLCICICWCEKWDPPEGKQRAQYLDHLNWITTRYCRGCGSIECCVSVSDDSKWKPFQYLETEVIRPFVLHKIRRQFEDWFVGCLPIQNLIELVGEYLYVEPSRKRNQQRKRIL